MDRILALIDWQDLAIVALVFVSLERLAPTRVQKMLRPHWANDGLYLLLNGILIRAGIAVLVGGAVIAASGLIPAAVTAAVAGQPLWLQVVEVFLIADLGFYAAHRLFHSVPFLWRFHAVHHSIEDLDWLAGHRVHPLDQILTKSLSLIPCFALGFSPWALGLFFIVYRWHSVLLHSNVRIDFGPLKWVVASPEFHRWHHANQADAYDKNFAGQLPLWDMVFGTMHMPQDRAPLRFGTDDRVPTSYGAQLLYPFLPARFARREVAEASA